MKSLAFGAVLLCSISIHLGDANTIPEKFSWKELSFDWPSDEAKAEAITSKRYQPENNLPLGLDIWKDKLFITVPR